MPLVTHVSYGYRIAAMEMPDEWQATFCAALRNEAKPRISAMQQDPRDCEAVIRKENIRLQPVVCPEGVQFGKDIGSLGNPHERGTINPEFDACLKEALRHETISEDAIREKRNGVLKQRIAEINKKWRQNPANRQHKAEINKKWREKKKRHLPRQQRQDPGPIPTRPWLDGAIAERVTRELRDSLLTPAQLCQNDGLENLNWQQVGTDEGKYDDQYVEGCSSSEDDEVGDKEDEHQ